MSSRNLPRIHERLSLIHNIITITIVTTIHILRQSGQNIQIQVVLLIQSLVRVAHQIQRIDLPSRLFGCVERQRDLLGAAYETDPLQRDEFLRIHVAHHEEPAFGLWFREERGVRLRTRGLGAKLPSCHFHWNKR